eukprot:jgi/Hompol1/633/HPOL_004246-RA
MSSSINLDEDNIKIEPGVLPPSPPLAEPAEPAEPAKETLHTSPSFLSQQYETLQDLKDAIRSQLLGAGFNM